MFEDSKWLQKILIGAAFVLLSVVLIGIPFVLGYMMEVIRRSYEDQEVPLPEWENWGELFTKGLIAFIITLAVIIPGIILSQIPCVQVLVLLYMIIVGLALPLLYARYAITGDLNKAFEFNEIMEMFKENIGNLVAVFIMVIIFTVIASISTLALFVGFFFGAFYAKLGAGFLYGKVYQEAVKKREAANVGGA
jgi:hypothetical protein